MQLKGGKLNLVKAQGFRAIGQFIFQVGAGPVQNRHEVVTHGIDATLGKITQRLLIIANPEIVLPCMGFDVFMNRHAFHDRPDQTGFLYDLFAFENFFYGPDFTVWNMMKRCYYAGCSGLTNIGQRHGIVRAIPTPGLFHYFISWEN